MADEVSGTATDDVQADQGADLSVAADTTAAASGTTDTAAAPKPVESFIDPSTLPEDIKPHWKRMHGTYTKKLEAFNARKPDHELLDRFRSDEGFALDLLRHEAQRRGLTLAPANGTTTTAPAPTARPTDGPSPQMIERVKARLDPSLHWLAESLADAALAGAQESTRPLVEKDQAKEKATRAQEFASLAGKLTEAAPGWEAHEDDMNALLDWIQSPSMTHPQFGDKLTFLYNAVTGGSVAKRAAIDAMATAGRSASRTGFSGRPTVTNTTERVLKAKNAHEAIKIAAEEAEAELRRNGHAVPD